MIDKNDKKKTLKYIKKLNLAVAEKFKQYDELEIDNVVDSYGQTYAGRIYDKLESCSKVISVYRNTETGEFRLMRHRCHNRFCPICNHVQSNNISLFLQQDYDNSDKDKTLYYTVVFTMKNCQFDDFGNAMNIMSKAFSNWHKNYSRVLHYVAGLRTFEFTYNKKSHTMHPHIHLLLKFRVSGYNEKAELLHMLNHFNFGSSFAHYLLLEYCGLCSSKESFKMMVGSQDLDIYEKSRYIEDCKCLPFVIFHAEKYNSDKTTLFEFSKYITKFNKLLTLDPVQFVHVYRSLTNFKTRAFLGEWRSWKKLINHENGDTWIDKDSLRQNAIWKFYSYVFINYEYINDMDLFIWLKEHRIIYLE